MISKCAIVGLGRMGCGFDDRPNVKTVNTHAGSYKIMKKAKLVAFCDIDEAKLEKYGTKYSVKSRYQDYNEMFENEELDFVSICTLADSHLEIVKSAAKNGVRGIFLEKPISDSLKSASEIVDVCKKNKIILQIDHQRRFDPFFHYVKKFLDKGKIGNIQLVMIFYGAGISNTGTHVFDLLRFLFGEAKFVKGKFSANKSTNPTDPNIDVEIEFKNKTIVKLNALDVGNYGILEMDVFGTTGRLKINLVSNETAYYRISQKNNFVYKELEKSNFKIKQSNQSSIILGLQNLVDCVNCKVNPLCS